MIIKILTLLLCSIFFTQAEEGTPVEAFGTLNSIENGFGQVQECQAPPNSNGCDTQLEDALAGVLNLATTNECISSASELQNSGIDVPDCPSPGEGFQGLDHSYPVGSMFAMYTMKNSAFLQDLVTEYLQDNPNARFNLVVPRNYSVRLANDSALIQILNNPKVNIVHVNTMPSVDRWMQDSFEFGSLNGKPALYQLEHASEAGRAFDTRLACDLARSCDIPYVIPPDMVDPNNQDYSNLNSGGNLETMPGGTIYRGVIQSAGFYRNNPNDEPVPFITPTQQSQRRALESAGNRVLDLDTSFLHVGHVDEIINFVPTNRPAPCDFALMLASPEKAFELMEQAAGVSEREGQRTESQGFVEPVIDFLSDKVFPTANAGGMALNRTPCDEFSFYNLAHEGQESRISPERVAEAYSHNCMDGEPIGDFIQENDYQVLKRINLEGDDHTPSIASVMARNREAILTELRATSGCQNPPIIEVPVFFRGGLAFAPDLVNGVVQANNTGGASVIMPRTYFKPFDDYMAQSLEEYGVRPTFVHGMGYHIAQGQVHCGTNTARICK